MTFYVDNEDAYEFPFDLEEVADKVAKAVLKMEACPFEAEISLSIVSSEEIREANHEFRNIDKVTDVLSFPYLEYEEPGVFPEVTADMINPENGEVVLGDIVICYERAREQAEEYGHSLLREVAFLIAHSMLHLCGYDHLTEAEAEVMFAKQEEILNLSGYTRDN